MRSQCIPMSKKIPPYFLASANTDPEFIYLYADMMQCFGYVEFFG